MPTATAAPYWAEATDSSQSVFRRLNNDVVCQVWVRENDKGFRVLNRNGFWRRDLCSIKVTLLDVHDFISVVNPSIRERKHPVCGTDGGLCIQKYIKINPRTQL